MTLSTSVRPRLNFCEVLLHYYIFTMAESRRSTGMYIPYSEIPRIFNRLPVFTAGNGATGTRARRYQYVVLPLVSRLDVFVMFNFV